MDLSNYQSFLDSLLIVLVLYKSNLETSDSFQSIVACFKASNTSADIFIYDNSPQRLDFVDIYNLNIHYVWDASNPGVSKAYNEGFNFGRKAGKKWLLLLDQDTEFDSDFLTKYYNSCNENVNISLFAPILRVDSGQIYSPCKYKFPRTSILEKVDPGITYIKNLSLLNSGMLISLSIFQEVGGYDDRLKMDFTDFEFIDRYRKIENIFVVVNTTGRHGFSGFQDELDASLVRFNRYCQSSIVLSLIYSNYFDKLKLIIFALVRAFKLSFKFNFFEFVTIFLNHYFPHFLKILND